MIQNSDAACQKSQEDQLADQFYAWERKGRGWQIWDETVVLEPAFEPFFAYTLDGPIGVDDGRKQSIQSGILHWLSRLFAPQSNPALPPQSVSNELVQPEVFEEAEQLVEIELRLPRDQDLSKETAEQFLLSLTNAQFPIAFELIGLPDRICLQFVCAVEDRNNIESQLAAHFPEVVLVPHDTLLVKHWVAASQCSPLVVEFGLSREFMLPLAMERKFSVDPLSAVMAVLSGVNHGEMAVLQVLIQPTRGPWSESILRAVTLVDGEPLFKGGRDIAKQARKKISRPLLATVIRFGCRLCKGRNYSMAREMTGALATISDSEGNELFPLDNDGYDPQDHESDLLDRSSRRSGMILNTDELCSLVHPPSSSVTNSKLHRLTSTTKSAPRLVFNHRLILGDNDHNGIVQKVSLSADQRTRHMHVLGASGTGKSTFLLNQLIQDIHNGDGLAVLDPHGELIDNLIGHIPPERASDVVMFDPSDEDYPIGFNILNAHSSLEKNLLSSDLVSIFRRLSTSWGDQMNAVLANGILAILESKQGGTLLDLRRFLVEPQFRKQYLTTVEDPEVVYYWAKEFPLLASRSQGPVLTRLDSFLRPKIIRYMVAQQNSRLDFGDIMDKKRVFLARLSHGAIGEENSSLLGALLVTKFHQLALCRQRQKEQDREYFWLYIDEFQNFATPSMATILSGARKYRMGLILAHQELHQLESKSPEVAAAVIANAYSRVCFRLGDNDAKKLANGFSSFDATCLQNLGIGEAICRVERKEQDFNLRTPPVLPRDEKASSEIREQIVKTSRARYATPRAEVEAAVARVRPVSEDETELSRERPRSTDAATRSHTRIKAKPPFEMLELAGRPRGEVPPVPEKWDVRSNVPSEPANSPPEQVREPALPSLGRGGPKHKYLQELIKRWAEGMGYRADIEGAVGSGRAADVALTKGEVSIACEICVTTDPIHELGNLRKCIAAGFGFIVAVSTEPKRLTKIQALAESEFTEHERKRVRFFSPDELFSFVQELEISQVQAEKTVRGYKVKTTFRKADQAEGTDRQQSVSRVIANAIVRMKSKK